METELAFRAEKTKTGGRLRVPPGVWCEVVRPANGSHTYLKGWTFEACRPLGPLVDFEFNRLAIIQRLVGHSH